MENLRYIELENTSDGEDMLLEIDSVLDQMLRFKDPEGGELPELMPSIDPQDRPHLNALYGQLVSQYLEPIAQFMHLIRREARATETLESFRNLLKPILQLTETLEEKAHSEIVLAFLEHTDMMAAHKGSFTYKHLEPLNELFDRFLNALGQNIREQYLATCYYQRNSNPLLEEIRRVKYIGPKRLQRLYSVGLVTVEAISRATPQEIVDVTGLPLKLAEQVIEVTRTFMAQERANRRRRLQSLCEELSYELKQLTNDDHELVQDAAGPMEALSRQLTTTLHWLKRPHHDRSSQG